MPVTDILTRADRPTLTEVRECIDMVNGRLAAVTDFLNGPLSDAEKQAKLNECWEKLWIESRLSLLPPTGTVTCLPPSPKHPAGVLFAALLVNPDCV